MTWAIPTIAAAGLAWILFAPRQQARESGSEMLRARGESPSAEGATFVAIAPPNGGTVTRDRVEFVWHSRAGQPLFRLTLSEADRALWSTTTKDTTLLLPSSVSLTPGRTYLWSVDALDATGRSVTSGTQRFVIQP